MNNKTEQKRIFYGYYRDKDGSIKITESEYSVINLIFLYHAKDRFSLERIKDIFEGIRLRAPRGGRTWSRQTIANILSNYHYIGDETYPQIIAPELFNEAQIIRKN